MTQMYTQDRELTIIVCPKAITMPTVPEMLALFSNAYIKILILFSKL